MQSKGRKDGKDKEKVRKRIEVTKRQTYERKTNKTKIWINHCTKEH